MLSKDLSEKDKRFCIIWGIDLAKRCVNGGEDSAINLDNASKDLEADVYEKFKIELIYCRIYIAFHIFKYELDIKNFFNYPEHDKFENWWKSFHLWLSKHWNKSLYEITYNIEKYSKTFFEKGSSYSKLILDDSIIDDLLINAGFKGLELSYFNSRDLKEFFIKDCNEHKAYVDNAVFWICLDSEIRDETLAKFNICF